MKELLEAGVHFGHQTRRWNPKMKEYIFGERNGIHIIDLQKTLKMFREAARYVAEKAGQGKSVLFLGTKRQAQEAIAEEAERCGMFYVNHRWLGGTLTNWVTLQKSIKRLKLLKAMVEDGRMAQFSKKEGARLERELKHLQQNFSGVENMATPPDVMFVIDPNSELIAVREARRMGIPVVAIVDTNCDPTSWTGSFPAMTTRCARFACSRPRFPTRCSPAASRSNSRKSPSRRLRRASAAKRASITWIPAPTKFTRSRKAISSKAEAIPVEDAAAAALPADDEAVRQSRSGLNSLRIAAR